MSENENLSPRDVMKRHGRALVKGDLDAVVENYSTDAIFITPDGVYRGRDGVREAQSRILSELANARFEYVSRHLEDDIMFLEWKAEGDDFVVSHGVDSIVFGDGVIRAQTIRYSREPKA
ncbi:nuclear transport factor 2 family protein [Rhodococcus opacus]|uniref:nuclear transport factor 2 family protein n=1 Tax=Rhodococcus opacus TaxID=37919 RepID=UPI001C43733F|nr:nuclear transport factor 2 family protein [Rhodococcus opacus]MBV6756701.1 nuclear transport factor 2 family protein [Rhodococcus opacus]